MAETNELPKTYDPQAVEPKWYDRWEQAGYFKPQGGGTPYCVMIPPPNVTGSLHVGHALNNTMQDVLVRYKRMDGFRTLWQPGTDHAGIATQKVVSDLIRRQEGKTRDELGREEFLKRVWAWKEESGGMIVRQLKRLGASCDWSRERFTMDGGLSRAVRQAFVTLFEAGLLQRDLTLTNWCPGTCKTVLSDLEVEHQDVPARPLPRDKFPTEDFQRAGRIYHIRYPLAEPVGGVGHLVVATTRPETLLGDTAVAVNPEDERYAGLLAARARIALPLTDRVIPLIADAYVDRTFGSGAVKITPAHDPNDFEVGKRHDLARITVLDADAKVNGNGFAYAGLDRFEARRRIVADLAAKGLLEKVEGNAMSVGHCQRCQTVVEPMLSTQWFVRTKRLAEPAIAAVKEGRTRFVPEERARTYFTWMENIRDWCVSRQLWWGHQIPAWYCERCDAAHLRRGPHGVTVGVEAKPIVSMTDPKGCPSCGGPVVQDPDVLDTWFSSGTWPFSTLGWPDATPELKTFYPTSALVTGFDIIFFWVARMMMFGLFFLDDVPFRDVNIHGLVRDEKGDKMSKTKGNVMDPLVLMDRYGTDALRFTLCALNTGSDLKLSEAAIEGNRNFANKLWNASRFLLMRLPEGGVADGPPGETLPDRWILSRLQDVIASTREALDEYRFGDLANGLYRFAWGEVCDWYLEMIRPVLDGPPGAARDATLRTAIHVFDHLYRLLHPLMPYLTEELWLALPLEARPARSIVIAPFPKADPARKDRAIDEAAGFLQAVISAIRNVRGEMAINPGARLELVAQTADPAASSLLERERAIVQELARIGTMTVRRPEAAPKGAALAVVGPVELFIPLKGVVDLAAEKARLRKELGKIAKGREGIAAKLANDSYVARAPAEVVERDRAQLAELDDRRAKLEASLKRVEEAE